MASKVTGGLLAASLLTTPCYGMVFLHALEPNRGQLAAGRVSGCQSMRKVDGRMGGDFVRFSTLRLPRQMFPHEDVGAGEAP